MPLFRYRAMDSAGTIVAGRIDAGNLADLEARLLRLGLDLIEGRPLPRHAGKRMPRRELIHFCFHLEQLVRAGVPLTDSLADLRDSATRWELRDTLAALVENVQGGKRLSEAMAACPRAFDPIVVNLVRAGEDSGRLPEVLADLVASLKWQDELSAQARRLATYPAVLAAVTLGLILFMLVYLVPRFAALMKGMGRTLPWHAAMLESASHALTDHWALALGGPAAVAATAVVALRRNTRARVLWDSAKLRLPVFGGILRKLLLARFATVFALLYGAGIPVLDAIRTAEKVVGNGEIARGLRRAARFIAAGDTVHGGFDRVGLFPPLVVRMLRVGEGTGELDRALANVSYFFHRDVREGVDRLQALAEPAAVLVIGGMMVWIVVSVLGPVYDLIAGLGV